MNGGTCILHTPRNNPILGRSPVPIHAGDGLVMNDDQLLADMFQSFQLFVDGQRISVDLSCPVRRVMTNGTWNEQSNSIQWKTDQQGSLGMPALAEAIWAEPNSEEQTQRFGEVILEGAKLGAYTVWYAGLSKDEAKEWDAFVATWQPGPELIRSIELFRFSFDPPSKKERVFALDLSGGEIASTVQRETSLVLRMFLAAFLSKR